ncbi:MAG: hypothetical protein R3281_11605 [Balneolaceae bacterium]|nr:hypothetical protein [Balneolaceae bacterium]
MPEKTDNTSPEWKPRYWLVFLVGVIYILLLGLFTFLFNNPTG